MRHIIICHHITQGLANDAVILKDAISKASDSNEIKVSVCSYPENDLYIQCKNEDVQEHSDDNDITLIFLEHINERVVRKVEAKRTIFIPNIEWITNMDIKLCRTESTEIVAKTTFAYQKLTEYFPDAKIHNTGWTSIDRFVNKEKGKMLKCLHLKGVSRYKGSQQVLDIWTRHPEWPELHIVSWSDNSMNGNLSLPNEVKICDNVILHQYKLNESELSKLMNECEVHICPSYSEGFGHYINEALSTGAVVLTTDGEPMNELVRPEYGALIPVSTIHRVRMGLGFEFTDQAFESVFNKLIFTRLKIGIGDMSKRSRSVYVTKNDLFLQAIAQLLFKR